MSGAGRGAVRGATRSRWWPWLLLAPLVIVAAMTACPVPAQSASAAAREVAGEPDSDDLDEAEAICLGLLPGFAAAPEGLVVETRPGGAGAPTGIAIRWRRDAAAPERGAGSIVCWFLPRERSGGAWQIATVESSAYGTLTRYDVMQLYKLLRLRPDDPERRKIDPQSPYVPWLYLLQQVINGLSLGGLYALIAVGFSLIYAGGRIINLAIGEIAMIGAFLALFGYVLHRVGGPGPELMALLSPVLVVAVCGVGGWLLYRLVFRRLAGGGLQAPLIATVGLAIALREAARLLQGPATLWLPPQGWSWPLVSGLGFDVYVGTGHLVVVAAAALAALALWQTGRATRIGRSFRAATDDAGAAALMGVSTGRLFGAAAALGAAFAGTAGGFAAWQYGAVEFHMGVALGMKALTAAVVGGVGSVPGAFLGGLVVAAAEVAAAATVGGAWRDMAVYGLLVLFLVLRPQGLLGRPHDPFERAAPRFTA